MKKTLAILALFITTNTFALDETASGCEFNHINYKQAVAFVNTFKAEIQKNNKQAIAAMATYPLTVNETKHHHTIKNKQQLLKDFDTIFTANMKVGILQDQEPIFCNYQGAMIAHGIIWFNTEKDKAAFFAVNTE